MMDENDQIISFTDDNSAGLSEESFDSLNSDWDAAGHDGGASGFDTENPADEGAYADQQSAGAPQEDSAAPGELPQDAKAETDLFTLKHLDEKRTVSRDEVIALAQKGLDYDRIRAKYDALRADQPQRAAREALLQELAAGTGRSVDELLQSLSAGQTEAQGEAALPDPEAPAPVQREEQPGRRPADAAGEAARQRSYLRFSQEYPGVKPEEIPAEIWRDFAAGRGDLADLFARHENKQLKAQLAAERQNQENRKKSTGSRATAGSAMSKLDADWYDGT